MSKMKQYPKDEDLLQIQKQMLMEIHACAGIHSAYPYTNVEGIRLTKRYIKNYLFIRDYRISCRERQAADRRRMINAGELKIYG